MDATSTSLVVRRLRPLADTSLLVGALGRAGRTVARPSGGRAPVPAAPPLTFAALVPAVSGSVLVSAARACGRRLDAWFAASATARLLRRWTVGTRAVAPHHRVALVAIAVAVASATHLAMLAWQPYPFPRPTAAILPSLVGVVALFAIPCRHHIARALADRRARP